MKKILPNGNINAWMSPGSVIAEPAAIPTFKVSFVFGRCSTASVKET